MKSKSFVPPAVAFVMSCALGAMFPAAAFAGDGPWQIRVLGLSMNPSGKSVVIPDTGERISYNAANGYGLGVDLEYRASRRLSIDFGVLSAAPEIDVLIDEVGSISASAKLRTTPIFAVFNVHLTPDGRTDLYVGPLLAYVIYSSIELVSDPWFSRDRFVTDNDVGVGFNVGLDIRLGDAGWALTTALKYLDTTLEASPPDESVGRTAVNPWIFGVGVSYRF
jgi:outer membrane protein W